MTNQKTEGLLLESEDANWKIDVYEQRRRSIIADCLKKMDDTILLPEQRIVLKQYFAEHRSVLAPTTLTNKIKMMYYISLRIKKPYSLITKEDLIEYFNGLEEGKRLVDTSKNKKPLAKNTIIGVKLIIMSFFRWFLKEDKPEIIAWMGVPKTKMKIKAVDELITIDDVEALINVCDTDLSGIRNKVMIMMLYELGARAEELVNIKLRDIKDCKTHGEITIKQSKTEPRVIFIVKTMPYLREWLNIHPFRNQLGSYLFVSLRKCFGKGLQPAGLTWKIKDLAKKAGFKKIISSHLFRHTSAQNDSNNGFSEKDLRYKYGWSKTSNMTARYTRPDLNEIRRKTLELHGIKPEIDKDKDIERLMPKICPNCRKENTPTSFYCDCGMPLSNNMISKDKEAQDTMAMLISKYPELAGLIKELLKKELN